MREGGAERRSRGGGAERREGRIGRMKWLPGRVEGRRGERRSGGEQESNTVT